VIRQSQKYEPRLLLEAWQCFEKEEIGEARNPTVLELVEKFVSRQKAQGRSTRTLIDDRSRLKAMTNVMGHIRGAVKRADILRYMEGIPPGTNRQNRAFTNLLIPPPSDYCRRAIEGVDSCPERRLAMDTTTYASVAMLPKSIAEDHAHFVQQDLYLLPLDLSMIKR
jgi:hypothetical protein